MAMLAIGLVLYHIWGIAISGLSTSTVLHFFALEIHETHIWPAIVFLLFELLLRM